MRKRQELNIKQNVFLHCWNHKPLITILIIAFIVRMVAAIFSQGYGMHDDHFSVIEVSQSWVDGGDYNNWLPWNRGGLPKDDGHSFFYPGLHFYLFKGMESVGIFDAKVKMLINRILHVFLSLVVVFFGYKITERLTYTKLAKEVGLVLALLWCMPYLSVRNLVEIVCIPFLMTGLWLLLKSEDKKQKWLWIFISGLVMGISFSVRFQTSFLVGGTGLTLLIMKRWREALWFSGGALIINLILQGIPDFIIWGYPFAELQGYIADNMANKDKYLSGGFEKYILVLAGLFLIPMGAFYTFGFFRTWRKYLIIFLPTFLFLFFHSIFPNKQERFIFPIIPYFAMLGIIGWHEFSEKSKFWNRHSKLLKGFVVSFWILNLIILPVITTAYTKRARVESMYYLSKYMDVRTIMIEDMVNGDTFQHPSFYAGHRIKGYNLSDNCNETLPDSINWASKHMAYILSVDYFKKIPLSDQPQFVFFVGNTDLEKRVKRVAQLFPKIEYTTTIEPSFFDVLLHTINPINRKQVVYIYKTGI